MRLTLRTLLAYLDNVLDPADAEQLGAKIKDSEFATGLKQRIQSIVTHPRMSAPKIDAKGLAADANNVAEYLDSSLPADRIGDFERVSLESDVSLAEAASCHQILTLVLGKPADVPVGLRERVYALNLDPTVAVASAARMSASPAGQVKPPPVPPPTPAELPTPPPVKAPLEVPDYLRAGRRSNLLPILGVAAAILLLALAGLRAMGPFDATHPLAWMVGAGGTEIVEVPSDENTSTPAADTVTPVEDNPNQGTADAAAPIDTDPGNTNPADTDPADTATTDAAAASIPPAPPENGANVPAEGDDAPPPPATTTETELPNDPLVTGSAAPPPMPMPNETADAETTVDGPPPPAGVEVGRFVSDTDVLARFDAANRIYLRIPSRALLAAGERLVSLPAYRPQLALPSGVQLTLVGESAIVLAPPREGRSVVLVDYGRMLVETAGTAGVQVEFNLTGLKGVATLLDANSTLAVEVRPYLPPGADPEKAESAIPVVDLFATRGTVVWQEEGQAPVEIPSNFARTYVGNTPPTTNGPFKAPEWTDARSLPPLDRETAATLGELLSYDKPLGVALQEQVQDRRVEVRALAVRSLIALDEFGPAVKELSDNRQYSYWSFELDSLREALARGPETAAAIRTTIEKLRPEVAEPFYRQLWGYSPEQLARGDAEQLVKALESPDMDIRVLTFDNLRRITGSLLLYRPERKVEQNKLAIQKWKEKLKEGSVVYKVQPSPLPQRKPLDRLPAE